MFALALDEEHENRSAAANCSSDESLETSEEMDITTEEWDEKNPVLAFFKYLGVFIGLLVALFLLTVVCCVRPKKREVSLR